MQVPEILVKIWAWIKTRWDKLDKEVVPVADAAVQVTNLAKTLMDSGVPATLAALTPTGVDDRIVASIQKVLPTVVADMTIVKGLVDAQATPDVALQTLLKQVAALVPNKQAFQWLELSASLTKEVSDDLKDGDLGITEAINLGHEIYNAIHK